MLTLGREEEEAERDKIDVFFKRFYFWLGRTGTELVKTMDKTLDDEPS